MTTRFKSYIILIALLAAPAAGNAVGFEIEGRYWLPDLSGQVEVGTRGVSTAIDLLSDLGMDDDEFIEGRLTLWLTRQFKVRAAFMPLSFAGNTVIDRTVSFSGRTFPLRTRIVSDLDLDYGRVGLAWQFIGFGRRNFRLGPIVEVKLLRGEAALTAPELPLPISVSEEFDAAFGSAGLALDVRPLPGFHLFAEATWSVAADEGDLRDAETGVRYRLLPTLWVSGGYRIIELEAEDKDDRLDFDLEGVFFGLVLSF